MTDDNNGSLEKIPEHQLIFSSRQLPVLYTNPIEQAAQKVYTAWTSFVNGQQVYALSSSPDELWCVTSGGILCWKWGKNHYYTWFGSEHGLHGTRYDWIALDGQGVPWVASKNKGVCYWDGQAWKHLTQTNGSPTTNVTCLVADRLGIIWIATKQGFGYVTWKNNKPELCSYNLSSAGLPSLDISCMAFNDRNCLIIGTPWGLFVLTEESGDWRRYTLMHGLPSNQITALHYLDNGDLFAGTTSGLACISQNGITSFSEMDQAVHTIVEGPGKKFIWILTSEMIWYYQNKRLEAIKVPVFENLDKFYSVTTFSEKSWIGSGTGVIEFNKGPVLIQTPGVRGLPEGGISHLAIDAQNNLWVGTTKGLWNYQVQDWHSLLPDIQLINPIKNISGIQPTPEGSVWVGSWLKGKEGGLRLFRGGVEIPAKRNGGPEAVDAMTMGSNGRLFLASGDVIFYQDDKNWQIIASPDPKDLIISLILDHDDQLFCGTRSGLYIQEQDGWRQIFDQIQVNILIEDSKGSLWVGTSQGLYNIKNQKYKYVEIDLPSKRIQALCKVGNSLWIGTSAGLVRWRKKECHYWDITNSGLAGQNVKALAMGTKDILWVGTSSGLSQFETVTE